MADPKRLVKVSPCGVKPRVFAAWAQRHRGPGYVNDIVYVALRAANGDMQTVPIYAQDRTDELSALFPVCLAATTGLTEAAARALRLEVLY